MARPRPWIEAFAPATVSNLGPGFDSLGLALDLHDEDIVRLILDGTVIRTRLVADVGVVVSVTVGLLDVFPEFDDVFDPAQPHLVGDAEPGRRSAHRDRHIWC